MAHYKKYSHTGTLAVGYRRDASNDHIKIDDKQVRVVKTVFENFIDHQEFGISSLFPVSNIKKEVS